MKRLLVLRPEPGAGVTVERARHRGLDAVALPLFAIEAMDWHAPPADSFDALLLTSANAVRCAGPALQHYAGLPTYAVGSATAEQARRKGLRVAMVGDRGVERLLEAVDPQSRLLHLCGEQRNDYGPSRRSITSVPVYRATDVEVDVRTARDAVVLVHSPRAGRRFAELVDLAGVARPSIAIAAISPAAAAAAGERWQMLESAATPDDEALLALAERLCNKSDPA